VKQQVARRTPTERERWLPYVRLLADEMRLRDWQVFIREDPPAGSEASASCYPVPGRRVANIRLSEAFFAEDAPEQRHQIVHELVHAVLAPFTRAAEAKGFRDAAVSLAFEYGVDALAETIASKLPLPPVRN
jgi:hypothetical protein